MTKEKQNKIIAEWLGGRWVRLIDSQPSRSFVLPKDDVCKVRSLKTADMTERIVQIHDIPNYVDSLDAMAIAESKFEGTNKALAYVENVKATILKRAGLNYNWDAVGHYRLIVAPADVRAEALIKTIGRWEEE